MRPWQVYKPVLVFSLEMPAEQIMMRMIASLARVDQTKIRTGQNLEEAEWSKIASVFGMFKQKIIFISMIHRV